MIGRDLLSRVNAAVLPKHGTELVNKVVLEAAPAKHVKQCGEKPSFLARGKKNLHLDGETRSELFKILHLTLSRLLHLLAEGISSTNDHHRGALLALHAFGVTAWGRESEDQAAKILIRYPNLILFLYLSDAEVAAVAKSISSLV